MAQFLRPDGDTIAAKDPNGWSRIDEVVADDGDFVETLNGAGNGETVSYECSLSDPSGVPGAGATTARFRVGGSNGNLTLVVTVYQGATLIASHNVGAIPRFSGPATYSFTPDMASVTDWSDLRLRFAFTNTAGGTQQGFVSWAELEVPDGGLSISPAKLTNVSTVFAVALAAVAAITPAKHTNASTIYPPTVAATSTVAPDKLTNSSVIYSPTVTRAEVVAPALIASTSEVFEPTLEPGAVTTRPNKLANVSVLYGPELAGGPSTLAPALLANTNVIPKVGMAFVTDADPANVRKPIPVDANRKDWPRLVAKRVNEMENRLRELEAGTFTFSPASEPTDPEPGLTYFDSGTNKLRTYDGTTWQDHW